MSRRRTQLSIPPVSDLPAQLRRGSDRRGRIPDAERALARIDAAMLERLSQARTRDGILGAGERCGEAGAEVVVAVSGGADSVALLHLLARLRTAWSLRLVVAHLDHGLRSGSAGDASFVADLASSWDLALESATLPQGALAQEGNLEAAARRARYRFLGQAAARLQRPGRPVYIAVAHNANDQAETVLMNLIRGSGLSGLAAMRRARPLDAGQGQFPGILLVRPLLGIGRPDILCYLEAHGVPWREDPTNRDLALVRNRVRHEFLPLLREINPRVVESLCRTASILGEEAKRADVNTESALQAAQRKEPPGPEGGTSPACRSWRVPLARGQRPRSRHDRQVFDLRSFSSLDAASQRASVRAAGLRLGLPAAKLGFDAVERVRQMAAPDKGRGGPYSWVGGLSLTRTDSAFSLHRGEAAPFPPSHPHLDRRWREGRASIDLPVPGAIGAGRWTLSSELLGRADLAPGWTTKLSPWEACIDAGDVERVVLRAPAPGLRFTPLGLGGRGKALADYFTDRKVPRFLREGWPLLFNADELIWVAGHQISESVRITARSRRIIHLYWEENPE